ERRGLRGPLHPPDHAGYGGGPLLRRHRAAPAPGVDPAGEPRLPAGGGKARLQRGGHPGATVAHQRGLAGPRVLFADGRRGAPGADAQVAEHPDGDAPARELIASVTANLATHRPGSSSTSPAAITLRYVSTPGAGHA